MLNETGMCLDGASKLCLLFHKAKYQIHAYTQQNIQMDQSKLSMDLHTMFYRHCSCEACFSCQVNLAGETVESSVTVHYHTETHCQMLISDTIAPSFFFDNILGHWGPQNNLLSRM